MIQTPKQLIKPREGPKALKCLLNLTRLEEKPHIIIKHEIIKEIFK